MPRVDFHFNVEHRLQHACRVVRKARAANAGVLVYARDADLLARFDTALWTFSALDFLPHVYADSPLAAQTPVLLCADLARCTEQREVLLNLDDDCPPDVNTTLQRFERVIEVVARDTEDRDRARLRFRAYREAGFDPQHLDIAKATAA